MAFLAESPCNGKCTCFLVSQVAPKERGSRKDKGGAKNILLWLVAVELCTEHLTMYPAMPLVSKSNMVGIICLTNIDINVLDIKFKNIRTLDSNIGKGKVEECESSAFGTQLGQLSADSVCPLLGPLRR